MDWSVGRGRRRPPRRSLLFSVAGHALVVTLLILSPALSPEPAVFESFEVVLVSPPAEMEEIADVPAPPEVVVETPDPEPQPEETPPPPPPDEPAPVEPEPEPEPEPAPPPREPEPSPPPEERPPAAAEPPEEPTAESGADINVRLEGLRRDFPVYYANIIRQIDVCFRPPPGANLRYRAVVYFEIRADGTVSERRLVERSGNAPFDYAALGAVECAGAGRFGPLPDDLPYERLPVQFTFEPKGQ